MCKVAHPVSASSAFPVPEYTIPPFAQGYQLISLYPSSSGTDSAVFTQISCQLPADSYRSVYLPLVILLYLVLLLRKLASSITFGRSAIEARSNGLPVHHSRSLSHNIMSAFTPRTTGNEYEDDDATFPPFMDAYRAGEDSGDMEYARMSKPATGHTRRVSRVWTWEKEGLLTDRWPRRLARSLWLGVLMETLVDVGRLTLLAVGLWGVIFLYFS